MDLKQLTDYLLTLKGAEESYPFGPETQVFKIQGKMFALIGYREGKDFINLKADPHDVFFLTEEYSSITPGYHMDKKHWVSVEVGHSESAGMLKGLVDDSYQLVKSKLTKKLQAELDKM